MRGMGGLIISLVALAALVSYMPAKDIFAAQITNTKCKPYQIIYARGSGQLVEGPQPERESLKANLSAYGIDLDNFVELQDSLDPTGKNGYWATSVNGDLIGGIVGLGAVVTRGNIGLYSKSVDGGKEVLLKYLLEESNVIECNTRLVLSGYSQGAEVIGETVNDKRFEKLKNQVSYIALFGDPTLDIQSLNAGNIFYKPAWFKGDAVKFISGGITSPRNPYFTEDMYGRVGSWCIKTDVICTGILPFLIDEKINHTHSKYPEKFIPEAAYEIAKRLKEDLPNLGPNLACVQKPHDIVLTIDTSEATRRDYVFFGKYPDPTPDGDYGEDGAKHTVLSLFKAGCDVRVAIVGFSGEEDGPPRLIADFSSNPGEVMESIRKLYKEDGSNIRVRTQAREGIIKATSVDWRNNSRRSILFVTNTESTGWNSSLWRSIYQQTDYLGQPLTKAAIQAAREKQISIYTALLPHKPITPTEGYASLPKEFFSLFTNATGGKQFVQRCYRNDWTCVYLDPLYMTNKIDISVPDITLKVGETKTIAYEDRSEGLIDQLKSRNIGVSDQWRFDCGTTKDEFMYGREVNITATSPGECVMALYIYSGAGIGCFACAEWFDLFPNGIATFKLTVLPADYVAPQPPRQIANLIETTYDDRREYTWESPESGDSEVAYVAKDESGDVLSVTDQPRLTVTDTKPHEELNISITAMNEHGASEPVSIESATKVDATTPKRETPPPANNANAPVAMPILTPTPRQQDEQAGPGQSLPQDSPTPGSSRDSRVVSAAPQQTVRAQASSTEPQQPAAVLSSQDDRVAAEAEESKPPSQQANSSSAKTNQGTLPAALIATASLLAIVMIWLVVWRRRRKKKKSADYV